MNNSFYKARYPWGFTLLELLVVVGGLAILAGVILLRFPGTQSRARDTLRRSNLEQYTIALGQYSIKTNGLYPVHTSSVALTSLCGTLEVPDCPDDPQAPSKQYLYQSNAEGTEFTIWADLETEDGEWAKCSNGLSGTLASNPIAGSCPIANISPTSTPIPAGAPTNTPIPPSPPVNTPTPPSSPPQVNVLANPNFESGLSPWAMVTDGTVTTGVVSGYSGNSVRIRINDVGTNTFLHQSNLTIYPNTTYYLEFVGRSNNGNDIWLYLDDGSFNSYGLAVTFDLTSSWQTFSYVFTTNSLSGANPSSTGRLRFGFVGLAQSGSQYEFDSVILRPN